MELIDIEASLLVDIWVGVNPIEARGEFDVMEDLLDQVGVSMSTYAL
jgi:hypothetical protein